jgi:hypothetical protein
MGKERNPYDYHKNGQHAGAAYRQDHCVRMDDILHKGLDYSFLKIKGGVHSLGARNRQALAKRIVHDFLDAVIGDLIEQGNIYQLPIQQGAQMRVVRKPDRAVKSISKRKRYVHVDVFESDFHMYEIVLDFIGRSRLRRRMVHIDKTRYQRMCELVNGGKRYLNSFN